MILKDDFILSAIIQSTKCSYFNSIQGLKEWPFMVTLSISQLHTPVILEIYCLSFPGIFVVLF